MLCNIRLMDIKLIHSMAYLLMVFSPAFETTHAGPLSFPSESLSLGRPVLQSALNKERSVAGGYRYALIYAGKNLDVRSGSYH
jgi:hypothetical protein